MLTPVYGGTMCHLYDDTELADGLFRVEGAPGPVGPWRPLTMNEATRAALSWADALPAVMDVAEVLPGGTYPIPRRVIEPEVAREVEQTLEMLEPGDGTGCSMPHCLQPEHSRERGFPLCATHGAYLNEWDDLLAPA